MAFEEAITRFYIVRTDGPSDDDMRLPNLPAMTAPIAWGVLEICHMG